MAIEQTLSAEGFSAGYKVDWASHLGHGCDVNIRNGATPFVGTLTLRISYDKESTFYPIKTYTTEQSEILRTFQPGAFVSIGFASGDYTSGDADIRLGSGPV